VSIAGGECPVENTRLLSVICHPDRPKSAHADAGSRRICDCFFGQTEVIPVQDQWYGDKRDLVKWGTLLTLAQKYGAKHILQVLYYRTNDWDSIEIDGDQMQIPSEVTQHFRDCRSICKLKSVKVQVLDQEFHDRDRYLQYVLGEIEKRYCKPGIIFLDPDTGLEPNRRPNLKHVLETELRTIWNRMSNGDVLVFYQRQRRIQEWQDTLQNQFANILGVQEAKRAFAPSIAPDVAFFYAQRSDSVDDATRNNCISS